MIIDIDNFKLRKGDSFEKYPKKLLVKICSELYNNNCMCIESVEGELTNLQILSMPFDKLNVLRKNNKKLKESLRALDGAGLDIFINNMNQLIDENINLMIKSLDIGKSFIVIIDDRLRADE